MILGLDIVLSNRGRRMLVCPILLFVVVLSCLMPANARCDNSDSLFMEEQSPKDVPQNVGGVNLSPNVNIDENQPRGADEFLPLWRKEFVAFCALLLTGLSAASCWLVKLSRIRALIKQFLGFFGLRMDKHSLLSQSVGGSQNTVSGNTNVLNTGSGTIYVYQARDVDKSVHNIGSHGNSKIKHSGDHDIQRLDLPRHDTSELIVPYSKKRFNPFPMVLMPRRIDKIVKTKLRSVDDLHGVFVPKKNIPICVVDDKDGEKYKKGLHSIGYSNVRTFEQCPAFDELHPFAIVFFDMRGVGNAAGKDGFSLAKEYKRSFPYKKIIVRSGYLSEEQKRNAGDLDGVLEKNSDLCSQVAEALKKLLPDVSDPIKLWQSRKYRMMDELQCAEIALLEHKYVCAINLIRGKSDLLPGNWMKEVNELVGRDIF